MSINTQSAALKVSDMASPEVYSTVVGITDISGPSGSRQVIDATTLADSSRVKSVGIQDMGQVSLNLVWDHSQATNATMWTLFNSGAANNFQIVLPSSPEQTLSFSAFVLNLSITSNIDDVVRASITLEVSGAVTYA